MDCILRFAVSDGITIFKSRTTSVTALFEDEWKEILYYKY